MTALSDNTRRPAAGSGAREGVSGHPLPLFAELPELSDTGERSSWGVFGEDDELGTLQFATAQTIAAAADEIRSGRVICLSLPLDMPSPQLLPSRKEFSHHVSRHRGGSDDWLDAFYLQRSSQWDGLAHVRFREFGYYGGRDEEALDRGELGIDRMARRGLMGRAVLADVAGLLHKRGIPLDPRQRHLIGPALLEETLVTQGTALRPGDFLLIRTGWMSWYLSLDEPARKELDGALRPGEGGLRCPGLDPGRATAEWLWNHRISAVAADNPGVEAMPVHRDEGFLHRRMIALLGMPFGELFALDELAAHCAELGRWSFFLSSSPLNLPAGVGSPNNAHALL